MIDTLTATPFFGLGLSLLCWILAVKFQEKTGLLVCNPVLVSSLLVIFVLVVFRIPLENYNLGGDIIKMLLSPATAVLALNIYQQRKVLKEHFWPVVLGCLVGSLASILGVQLMCRMFQTESSLLNSLLPKSVTTAIAVSISESNGGLPRRYRPACRQACALPLSGEGDSRHGNAGLRRGADLHLSSI